MLGLENRNLYAADQTIFRLRLKDISVFSQSVDIIKFRVLISDTCICRKFLCSVVVFRSIQGHTEMGTYLRTFWEKHLDKKVKGSKCNVIGDG